MKIALRWSLSGLFALACACGESSTETPDAGAPTDSGVEPDSGTEEVVVDRDLKSRLAALHASGVYSLSQAKAVTSAFVHEDPTIDVTKTAGENADSIAAEIQAATATTCATADLEHGMGTATLTVTFPSTGCTVNGVEVSGEVAVSVTASQSLVKVAFQFTALSVSGHVLNGSVEESTTNGTTYSTKVTNLTADEVTYNYEGTQTLDGDLKGVTLNGSGESSKAGDKYPTTYQIATVHQKFQSCYPDTGTMSQVSKEDVTVGRRTVTVTTTNSVLFDSNTPLDGTVDVTVTVSGTQPVTKSVTLPEYGECPPG